MGLLSGHQLSIDEFVARRRGVGASRWILDTGPARVGRNQAIRTLVHGHITSIQGSVVGHWALEEFMLEFRVLHRILIFQRGRHRVLIF
jgi:hypothetical protein